jgi:hypothetical protein
MTTLVFLLVGAISGALSVAIDARTVRIWDVDARPGLLFAVLVGAALVAQGAGRTPRVLAWALAVVAAWILAARATVEAIEHDVVDKLWAAGLVGGLVGGAVVAVGGALLSGRLRRPSAFGLVVLVGGIAGLLLGRDDGGSKRDYLLFVVWQGAVAAAIGRGLRG